MELDVDTFLVTVYCVVDDLYRAELAPLLAGRPGARGKLSDSEVLALAALAQWEAHRCERCFLAYARAHWLASFPGLTSPSAFNRRARNLWAALCRLGPAIPPPGHPPLGRPPAYQDADRLPVPPRRPRP